jgi:hypothetical protein
MHEEPGNPSIAYLGPPIDHCRNLELLWKSRGLGLVTIADSLSWPGSAGSSRDKLASRGKLASRIARLRAQVQGTRDEDYLAYALGAIDEHKVRCVLAYWGTGPLADIKALKQRRPEVKFILNVLCHPLGLTRFAVWVQNRILGSAMGSLDGLIASSSVMEAYLREKIPSAGEAPILVLPPYWVAAQGPDIELPPMMPQPNILFIGRMDWKRGQPSDNVTAKLRELMRRGVEVHFNRSAESQIAEPNACPFEVVHFNQLSNFACRFDASLIAYNLDAVRVMDRFDNTVPDRLITSLSARLPIALPAAGFSACKEYLRDYGAVLEYSSMADLAEQLHDREHMRSLRKLAHARGAHFHAEMTFDTLRRFLIQVQPGVSGALG